MTNPPAAIRFLRFAGSRVAFAVSGDGPPLVAAAWWVSHLELDWRDEAFRSFWASTAAGHALVRYDHPGTGMSDREVDPAASTLDDEVALLGAVVDELGVERVSLLGGSSGSSAAIAYAARFPERVDRLLLYGAFAHGAAIAPPEVRDALAGAVRAHWGLGSRLLADVFVGGEDAEARRRFARHQRASAHAATAAALLELAYRTDVRPLLGRVRAPTLVVHRRGDRAMPFAQGRELAARLPDARLVALDGDLHPPWLGDSAAVVRAVNAFLDAHDPRRATPSRDESTPLSAREAEVLRLVAEGLSDAEIARRLIVSPHTVHRHVANIRTKLRLPSRTAAVAYAARAGLL